MDQYPRLSMAAKQPRSVGFTTALLEEQARANDTREFASRMRERMRGSPALISIQEPAGAPFALHPNANGTPPRNERVRTFDDNAALVDELGRDAFAEVVARRIQEAYDGVTQDPKRNGAVMVHLHGRWGSGKSSVLNFLKSKLSDEGKEPDDDRRVADKNWIVVEFNAWQHQRMPAPWWPLIRTIYHRCSADGSAAIRRRWYWRHFTMRWAQPVALVFLLLAIGTILLSRGAVEGEMKIAGAVLGLIGAAAALLKTPAVFSAKAAQELEEMRVNKQDLIKRFFEDIIHSVKRPIIVFIDDLDRCSSAYVVELLEGVQTLFKGAPVVYVVAADRDWIRKSFEQGYVDFAGTIGAPGRPLGHLFLEKMFQVSAGIPRIGDAERRRYWGHLLDPDEAMDRASLVRQRKEARKRAEEQVRDVVSMEEVDRHVEEARRSGDEQAAQAISEAGAVRIASAEVEQETEHRLLRFASLLEPNPRAMKRLVNAYGMNQATLLLQQRKVDADALARWTILEMRWPLFAEVLAQHPEFVEFVHDGRELNVENIAKETNALSKHVDVRRVVGREGEEGRLTKEEIERIVGESVAAEKLAVKEAAPPPNTSTAPPSSQTA